MPWMLAGITIVTVLIASVSVHMVETLNETPEKLRKIEVKHATGLESSPWIAMMEVTANDKSRAVEHPKSLRSYNAGSSRKVKR